jgi:hypothetical protein
MKTVADTLGVARSNLVEQVRRTPRRRQAYRKADDAWLLPLIRSIVDERPTYEYRRVGALFSRQVAALGKPSVNHKRVYRLVRQNGLLLARHTGTRQQRPHDGVVRTLRSNLRWCSDVFDVPCWNGETVRVAFVLDTCDREVITWTATTAGIAGEHIRDLMVEAIERRFGPAAQSPHAIEWLAPITAVRIRRMRPCLMPRHWGWSPASLRCTAPSPTAWPRASSKVSSGIMSSCRGGRMRTAFSSSWQHGSLITMRCDHITGCECTPHGSSFAANYPPQRVRFNGGNSTYLSPHTCFLKSLG